MANRRIEELVRALPKAELHIHLEGAIPPKVAISLASEAGVTLPGAGDGPQGVLAAYEYRNFDDFIALYVAISKCIRNASSCVRAVVGAAKELAEQNVTYAEMTFTPVTHLKRGVPTRALIEGLVEGRRQAKALGVELRWVFDVVRCFPEQAAATLDFALAVRQQDGDGVVGLGLGGPEEGDWPTEPLLPVFDRAKAAGLWSLPHAGEHRGPESVWMAVRDLGARRVGHGVRAVEDERLMEYLAEHQIALEVCPTSNVKLGVVPNLEAHPIQRLLDAGILVTLGSDDPPLFGTTLVDEYLRCAEAFDWSPIQIRAMAAAGVRASAMAPDAARAMQTAQSAAWARWKENPVDLSV